MKTKSKRCPFCGRLFGPDTRAQVQKCCGRPECRRARKRQNLKRWRVLHPDHAARYEGKQRAWAKAYPNYWQVYRAEHPEYAARDNQRRVDRRRRAKVSANETGMLRRVIAIEDCLRSTAAVALSARRNRLEGVAGLGG